MVLAPTTRSSTVPRFNDTEINETVKDVNIVYEINEDEYATIKREKAMGKSSVGENVQNEPWLNKFRNMSFYYIPPPQGLK